MQRQTGLLLRDGSRSFGNSLLKTFFQKSNLLYCLLAYQPKEGKLLFRLSFRGSTAEMVAELVAALQSSSGQQFENKSGALSGKLRCGKNGDCPAALWLGKSGDGSGLSGEKTACEVLMFTKHRDD